MNNIKKYRNELGLSVYDLSEKIGLTPSYISNLENGHKTNPTKETMEKIAAALGQSVPNVFYPN